MIENTLIHFENDSTFQTEKTNIQDKSITFVKDSKKIYTHESEYNMVNWGVLKKPEQKAGDICLVNNSTLEKLIIPANSYTLESYPADSYTPIGVVVVPNTHTDDGTARIISLKAMDRNNPDSGSDSRHFNIFWGGFDYDVPGIEYKTMYPVIAEDLRIIEGEQQIIGWYDFAQTSEYLPSDYFNNYPNPYDEGTFYMTSTTTKTYKANPSPYLTGGLKNEIYHSTENTGSILADMDGRINTTAILAVDNEAGTNWQTAAIITNAGSTETLHPAAQCTWRYTTTGTTQGEWYLPAAGELGYLAARWDAIESSFAKIRDNGFVALSLSVTSTYWSSTEYSVKEAVFLNFDSNYSRFGKIDKHGNSFVRAFLAV